MYCKTLIIRVTLFSRGHQANFIHETLFSRFRHIFFYNPYNIILIGEDFIFASTMLLANLRENKVLANKKCFTVLKLRQTL